MKYSKEHLKAWAERQRQYEEAIESGDFRAIVVFTSGPCPICVVNADTGAIRCASCILGPEHRWCICDLRRQFRDAALYGDHDAAQKARDWLAAMRAKARANGVPA